MTEVCIVQRRLTHYRVPFFEALKDILTTRDIQLKLLVGRGTSEEERKHDAGELSWAKSIPTYYFSGERLCWQSVQSEIINTDLVVITQENKLLQNHLLMLAPRHFKLVFWGHGANFQRNNPDNFREQFKRWTTNRVDWWLAYTQISANLVMEAGFPGKRITILNNAVDTSCFYQQWLSVTEEETNALRELLGFGVGPVGVFVGSLYADKRLDFLFSAAEAIRQLVPDFHLLIIGDGPNCGMVQSWCDSHRWAQWVGARFDREKAVYISVAQVMLNPGLVGLSILDSFVCGVPMLTTDCGIHSPEIAYLENHVNGVMTTDDLSEYVKASVDLLNDPQMLESLQMGCFASAQVYTVENMAKRFAEGLIDCLLMPIYKR